MSLPEFNKYSLSSLIPVEFEYSFDTGKTEDLKKDYIPYALDKDYILTPLLSVDRGRATIIYNNAYHSSSIVPEAKVSGTGILADTVISTVTRAAATTTIVLSKGITGSTNPSSITINPPLLKTFKHECLASFKDIALSKNNCLCLSRPLTINNIFNNSSTEKILFEEMAGTFKLRIGTYYLYESDLTENLIFNNANGVDTKYTNHTLKIVYFTVLPQSDGTFHIVANKNKKLYVNEKYPYDIICSQEVKPGYEVFNINYNLGATSTTTEYLTISSPKINRFLSYNAEDRILRATGSRFNTFNSINDTVFVAVFLTPQKNNYNFQSQNNIEIKYFNNFGINTSAGVALNKKTSSNTNFLMSCNINSISPQNSKIPLNLAMLKTNFSTSGSYFTKQTP